MDNNENQLTIESVTDILSALPQINSEANFWMVRANHGEYYDDFNIRGYIGVGYDELSLDEIQSNTNEKLTSLLQERKPKDKNGKPISSGTYTKWVGQLKRFALEIKPGDYVLVPSTASKHFSFGVVVEKPYEITSKDLNDLENVVGRKNSPYKKRIDVRFLKQFTRSSADPALYKMIYTQTTLSNINKYSEYILRAVYDAYVSDNNVYFTFPVRQKEDIGAIPYTNFTYNLIGSYSAIAPEDKPIIRNNVQSAGIVQLILGLSISAGIFGLVYVVLKSKKGFSIDINFKNGKFKFSKENDGVVVQRIKDAEADRTIRIEKANDEHLERLVDLANKAAMPMEEIQATISQELINATKKVANRGDNLDD